MLAEEEIMAMRDQADQCLYEEVEEMPLVLASWSESNRRIWCNG